MTSKLSQLLVELLCHISAEPESGYSEDEKDDVKIDSWQTLIHELNVSEKSIVKDAIRLKIKSLKAQSSLSYELQDLVAVLDAFLKDELQ